MPRNIMPLLPTPTRLMIPVSKLQPPAAFVGVAIPNTGPCPEAKSEVSDPMAHRADAR